MAEELPHERVMVLRDLGEVSKGDHVIIVAGFVVSLDTSRRAGDPVFVKTEKPVVPKAAFPPSVPVEQKRPYLIKRRKPPYPGSKISDVTSEMVFEVVARKQPIESIAISDELKIDRKDTRLRSKVTRLLSLMKMEGRISSVINRSTIPSYSVATTQTEASAISGAG